MKVQTSGETPTILEFKNMLKRNALKATPQRLAVHQAMRLLRHASADQVAARISEDGKARVTITSVYNILRQLSQLGIYRQLLSDDNKMYFDVNTLKHIHLYDVYNHTYKDILDEELLATVETALKKRRFKGFRVDGIDIQILCHPSHRKAPRSF